LENIQNTFTVNQTINSAIPRFQLIDNSQGVNNRVFELANYNQLLRLWSLNDAQNAVEGEVDISRAGNVIATGNYREYSRLAAMGHWQTGDCSSYLPAIGLSGPIRWSLVGKTLTILFIMSGVLSAGRASISLTIPGSLSSDASLIGFIGAGLMCSTTVKTWHTGVLAIPSATVIDLYDELTVAWPAGQVYINGTVIIAIP
jgi:hypothetical protein